jgi:uncharacterized protein YjiK
MNKKLFFCIPLLLVLFIVGGCQSKIPDNKGLPTFEKYNLNKPITYNLPTELDEISGLSYYAKDSSVFAISDDRGSIFKIKPGKDVSKWKFSHGADYEDLVVLDSAIYVLQSNGDIFKVSFNNANSKTDIFKFNIKKNNEFEAVIHSPFSPDKILLLCKDCEDDNKKTLTTFSFDINTNQFSDSSFVINVRKVDELLGVKSMKFKPSAAAINPKDSLIYMLSSINKTIVTTDLTGNPIHAYKLDPSIFKQPEGITFTLSGDMLISNEYAGTGSANILLFKRK